MQTSKPDVRGMIYPIDNPPYPATRFSVYLSPAVASSLVGHTNNVAEAIELSLTLLRLARIPQPEWVLRAQERVRGLAFTRIVNNDEIEFTRSHYEEHLVKTWLSHKRDQEQEQDTREWLDALPSEHDGYLPYLLGRQAE